MEHENYASRGVGNAGLTLGVIGTALGVMNNGGLGNLFGNGNRNKDCDSNRDTGVGLLTATAALMNSCMNSNCGCSEDHLVNRYEAAQQARIAELETAVQLRDSNIYTDQKILEVYKYFDGENKDIRANLAAQAVINQKTADAFDLVRNDMICCKNELYSAIARERDERCCGDNAIVNYSNATFYPKMVADVTTGTTTTAQNLYNPLPNCGCCNC